jgi:hypothetical protein
MSASLIPYAVCLLLLMTPNCHFRTTRESAAPQGSEPRSFDSAQSSKSSDLINSGVFDSNPIALNAWLKLIQSGKYRAANANDFSFSGSAKSELRRMFEDEWYSRVNHPAITGNISRRHGFKDLAVIVIDTATSNSDRFSVVIFNAEPDNKQPPSVHWLQKNCDLSSALLSWHNNWPVLVFYKQDGSSDPYYANWNENTKQYFLDKQQIGPDARPGRLREKGER